MFRVAGVIIMSLLLCRLKSCPEYHVSAIRMGGAPISIRSLARRQSHPIVGFSHHHYPRAWSGARSMNRSFAYHHRRPRWVSPSRHVSHATPPDGNHDSETVDDYLSKLRDLGRITPEEVQSILTANIANDDASKEALNQSIDIYLSTKQRRMDAGGEAIRNPGSYVRTIARKQLLLLGEEGGQQSSSPTDSKQVDQRNGQEVLDDSMRQILQNNDIGPNELNEHCLLALSRCSTAVAKNALNAYTRQKQRREMNSIEKIADPSSYVLAVIRNTEDNASATPSPYQIRGPGDSSDDNTASSTRGKDENQTLSAKPTVDKDMTSNGVISSEESANSTPMSKAMSNGTREMPKAGESPKPVQKVLAQTQQGRQEERTTVTMDYIDRCLSYLDELGKPIIQLSGVGPKTEAAFHKLGIFTLRDLLWHFPRSFIDRSKLQKSVYDVPDGEVGTFRLTVQHEKARQNGVTCTDEAGNDVDVAFFYGRSRQGMIMATNAMKRLCRDGAESVIVSGKVKRPNGKAELFNPDIAIPYSEHAEKSLAIEPVYALSGSLTRKKLVAAIEEALGVADKLLGILPDSIPHDALEEIQWPTLGEALTISHKPESMADTGVNSPARQRIAFEEMSMHQAQLALLRWKEKHWEIDDSPSMESLPPSRWQDSSLVSAAVTALPFDLSTSQEECLEEMWCDAIGGTSRMVRLLQGDVGSGKTVLSYLLGLGCVETRQGGGKVAALMAPTQLLASQHKRSISQFVALLEAQTNWKIHVELLTGTVVGKDRDELLARLSNVGDNEAVFLIGTHALTSPDISRQLGNLPLALAIVDEEQRFGVRQRQALTSCAAHSLYMSATPIPRSISLIKSGQTDLTMLQSEPRSVETNIVSQASLSKVVEVLSTKLIGGSKAFWILPRIGNTEELSSPPNPSIDEGDPDRSNVIERYKALVTMLGEEKVCHIHGRMQERERELELQKFVSSDSCVLVGTTVIEVGIDIPDVNILVVEDADHFGLSQLHQLRGRIGRAGSKEGIKCNCILLSDTNNANEDSTRLSRLQLLQRTNDCTEIAEADFMLRGPGDLLGFEQSGIKCGLAVDPEHHWNLIEAATLMGRSFLSQSSEGKNSRISKSAGLSSVNNKLVNLLSTRAIVHYNETSATSIGGFALRVMMSLFGEWNSDENNDREALNILQNLDSSKGSLSEEDQLVHERMREMHARIKQHISSTSVLVPNEKPSIEGEPVLPPKPQVVASMIPKINSVNLLKGDHVFVVLDVETTGVDDKSDHVIQLAAKILGSADEGHLFSEYALPPIDRLPKKIEELTGITDDFLRRGGYDSALDKERGVAREFRDVWSDFEAFCEKAGKGRQLVLVAHNAKFDIRMINGELRRWRHSKQETVPMLGDMFCTSIDTLQLFRDKKWWKADIEKPSSFSLSNLYSHVFGEPMSDAHNAVGDINALERLLLSEHFNEWENAANTINVPFIKVAESVK